nr:PREDICTED: uncharacterized protein LOC107077423 [Lepisosteus oculatus]XP_015203457.1 PREDICTED: uncharacterized protein LOC107077423 [Lepisosteus oculatus]
MENQPQGVSARLWLQDSEICESEREVQSQRSDSLPAEPAVEQGFERCLYRLFGRATAEYFLRPSPLEMVPSPRVLRVLKHMEDQVSGEALWRALREQSNLQLMKMEPLSFQTPSAEGLRGNQALRRRLQKSRLVSLMYRSCQVSQDRTSLLLFSNPLPDLSDPYGKEGPRRFLWEEVSPQEQERQVQSTPRAGFAQASETYNPRKMPLGSVWRRISPS